MSPSAAPGPPLQRALTGYLVAALARLYPRSVTPSEELCDAVSVLDWETSPTTLVRAGYGTGAVVGVLTAACGLSLVGPPALFPAALLGVVAVHAVHTFPSLLAQVRRTTALGNAPALVSRAVLRMKLAPAPERAASFAASSGEGLLAASLAQHVYRARHDGGTGLERFGAAWAGLFPPLRRALALVSAAGSAPPRDREQLLDRALTTVLDGTRERMRSFAADTRGPTTALYAFGVLLPTATIALLPAGAAVGLAVVPVVVVFAYNLLLPALLLTGGGWLLAQRPVAFPPPDVGAHPGATTGRGAVVAGPAVGVAAWLAIGATFPPWGPSVAAVGFGGGVTLWLRYRPVVAVYGEIRAAERDLGDALTLAGRRVAGGQPVETAVAETADELDGPLGEAFGACARRQRQLHVGVRQAFLGPYGALARLPSPRVRGSVALLALAAREGRPAGEALLALADHVEQLRRIRQEAHHDLAYVCRTLSSTAMLFGPLVAGATVALADGIAGETFGEEVALGWLGGPVGGYVLVLAVVLTGLSTALRRGFDGPLLGHRIGRALVCATGTYLTAYLLVGVVV